MLEQVTIRNWQSLVNVDLLLGRFTAIVGPSSSGKSALMRALRAVASNVSGTDKITRGQKTAAISVRTDTHLVTLEHGRFSNDTAPGWYYRLLPVGGTEERYTKLNRAVPQAITDALRIDPVPTKGASINFASQHDPPFLLLDSGANVARTLGELTNVDRIFEAGREALRRRNAASSTLKTREADLAALIADAKQYAGLPQRLSAIQKAEQTAEKAAALVDQASRLRDAAERLEVAQGVLERSAVLPELPSFAPVEQAQQRLDSFKALLRTWADRRHAASQWDVEAGEQAMLEDRLEYELHEVLVVAGTCPTCNRPI